MFNRKKLTRERLEMYLVYLFLQHRKLLIIIGIILLFYGLSLMFVSVIAGAVCLLIAFIPFLLGTSFKAILLFARLIVWLDMLGRKE